MITDIVFIASLLWPLFFTISILLIVTMCVIHYEYPNIAVLIWMITGLFILTGIYNLSLLRNSIRFGLSIFGFALPLALGVISVRYIVEQT